MSSQGDKVTDKYEERKRRNDESKSWAKRDGEPWTRAEEEVLIEYWIDMPPEVRDERTVSQVLERTIESCRARCEHVRARLGINMVIEKKVTTTTTYIGIMDDPDDQWWSPGYYK